MLHGKRKEKNLTAGNGGKKDRKKRPSLAAPEILDKLPKKSYKGGQK